LSIDNAGFTSFPAFSNRLFNEFIELRMIRYFSGFRVLFDACIETLGKNNKQDKLC